MKITPLHKAHQAAGAKMVPFAGWEMPIQYQSISAEHMAVRTMAGMFDVSHMGEFWVRGREALEFLQRLTPNDVSKLKVGRAQYSMLTNAWGGLVDDVYIYRTQELEYLMVVNAANIEKDWAHLNAHREMLEVTLQDESDFFSLLAVQGPGAVHALQKLTDIDLEAPKKNNTFMGKILGKWARFARTGYTGEDGYEVFLAPDEVEKIWHALMEEKVTPCGLGARDTLRLEAGFPLYGHEFTDDTSPLCTHMAWAVKAYKTFLGKDAMFGKPCTHKLVGLSLESGIPREGYVVQKDGKPVGTITSGTHSPLLKKGIGIAYVDAELAEVGTALEVEIRGKLYPATVVQMPFVKK
jgi:aminomethyltransferase